MLTLHAVCKTWAAAGHHPQQSGSDGGAQRPGADCGTEACAAVGCAVRPEPVACQGGAECPCQPPPTPRPPVHQHILPIGRSWLPLACTCMLVRPINAWPACLAWQTMSQGSQAASHKHRVFSRSGAAHRNTSKVATLAPAPLAHAHAQIDRCNQP